jgi:amino acid transporter
VVVAIVLYTLLQVAFVGALNWKSAGVAAGAWAKLGSSAWASAPLASALQASGMALLVAFAVLLYIDAYISPGGTGLVYAGTATRTVYGLGIDGYLPKIFQRVNQRWGIPVGALIASFALSWIFLLPLPSWYLLVGFISSATVLTYTMGGIGLLVLRRTAGRLHRPFRLPGAQVLAPIGFIAAALIVYWSGTSTLNYVVTAVFIGLPLYAWFYAPSKMGANLMGSIIAGSIMLAAILVTAYFGPLGTKALSFYGYLIALAAAVIVFSVYLWIASVPEKRRQIVTGAWFIVFLFGLYLLTYLGPFSTQAKPPIPFGWDELIVIVFALIMFYWAVYTGYQTSEIKEIVSAQDASGTSTPSSGTEPAVS